MKKLNAEMCKKLSDKGLIKKDTYDKVLKFANGGIVPTALDPNAGSEIVPDVATMQAPTSKIESTPVAKSMADQLEYKNLEGITEKDAALAAEEKIKAIQDARGPAANMNQPKQVDGYIPEQQSNPQEMQPQGMIGDYNQAFNTMESAIQQDAALGKQEAQKSMEYADMMANQMQQIQQKQEMLAASQRVELDNQFQKLNQAMNETANIKIDPSRVWADKSTGQKLGMAVALFFSGINGSQAGMQMLENSINRDLEAQRIDLATKKDALVAKRSLLGDMMQRFGNEQQALVAAKASALNIAEVKLKAQLAQLQGTKAGIEGQKALAEIQLKKAELAGKFKDVSMLHGEGAQNQKIVNYIASLPNSIQGKMFEEKQAYNEAKQAKTTIDKIYTDLRKKAGPMSSVTSPRMANLERETATAKLYPYARILAGPGTFSESDFDYILEPYMPSVTDSDAMVKRKKSSFLGAVSSAYKGKYATLQENGLVQPLDFEIDEAAPVPVGGKSKVSKK